MEVVSSLGTQSDHSMHQLHGYVVLLHDNFVAAIIAFALDDDVGTGARNRQNVCICRSTAIPLPICRCVAAPARESGDGSWPFCVALRCYTPGYSS